MTLISYKTTLMICKILRNAQVTPGFQFIAAVNDWEKEDIAAITENYSRKQVWNNYYYSEHHTGTYQNNIDTRKYRLFGSDKPHNDFNISGWNRKYSSVFLCSVHVCAVDNNPETKFRRIYSLSKSWTIKNRTAYIETRLETETIC